MSKFFYSLKLITVSWVVIFLEIMKPRKPDWYITLNIMVEVKKEWEVMSPGFVASEVYTMWRSLLLEENDFKNY